MDWLVFDEALIVSRHTHVAPKTKGRIQRHRWRRAPRPRTCTRDEARAVNAALLALCALAAPPKQKEKKERPPALSAPPSAPLARRAGY